MPEARMDKWKRWCEQRIRHEVVAMHLHRHAWREVARIVDAHGHLPDSYFWEYLRDTYAVTQAVAIRRQADSGARVITLGRLLAEIRLGEPRITRDLYLEMWELGDQAEGIRAILEADHANRSFDSLAGAGADCFDLEDAGRDLAELSSNAKRVKSYVDKHLAHSDAKQIPSGELPTFDDLDAAIDTIGHLFKKYVALLTASSYIDLVPAIQDDWLAIFREPWIPPKELA